MPKEDLPQKDVNVAKKEVDSTTEEPTKNSAEKKEDGAQKSFESLGLSKHILSAIRSQNYKTPTPIQAEAIPFLIEGRDIIGRAETGSGKTAAFALPMIERLMKKRPKYKPRVARSLVLAPTRELAVQIEESFKRYGKSSSIRVVPVYGGVSQNPQVMALKRGVDVLVATPGRLIDLINQRHCDLTKAEIFVLDEADRMLDMGFIPDIRRVLALLPKKRQTLFFSATMPPKARELADDMLSNPALVDLSPPNSAAENIEQKVLLVEQSNKRELLRGMLEDKEIKRALVFTKMKHRADSLAKFLRKHKIRVEAVHGDRSQGMRQRALAKFRSGKVRILVATDVAARGIDVNGITHVFNFDMPQEPEAYVHRIGRTARAGADGVAISFCEVGERSNLAEIEKLLKKPFKIVKKHPFKSNIPYLTKKQLKEHSRGAGRGRFGRRRPKRI